jgi:hypothetical protein
MGTVSFRAHVMAVDRVEKRLRRVTAALRDHGIPYAVIGGNAVAAWVGRVDPSATRATKDVDILVRRSDLDAVSTALASLGFQREDLRSLTLFVDPEEPSRRAGIHLVWADERVQPSYLLPAPSVEEAVLDPEGFHVLDLGALVRMKLTSLRDIDRVHIADMLDVGLVDASVRRQLTEPLRERLREIESAMDS